MNLFYDALKTRLDQSGDAPRTATSAPVNLPLAASDHYNDARDECKSAGYGDRRAHVYAEAYAEAMAGYGPMWPPGDDIRSADWDDNEQYLDLFLAVRDACRIVGTRDQRWEIVEHTLAVIAHRHADHEAERA